jgi:hypothetical protein
LGDFGAEERERKKKEEEAQWGLPTHTQPPTAAAASFLFSSSFAQRANSK